MVVRTNYSSVASDFHGLEREKKPRDSKAVFLVWASDQIVVTGEVRRVAVAAIAGASQARDHATLDLRGLAIDTLRLLSISARNPTFRNLQHIGFFRVLPKSRQSLRIAKKSLAVRNSRSPPPKKIPGTGTEADTLVASKLRKNHGVNESGCLPARHRGYERLSDPTLGISGSA